MNVCVSGGNETLCRFTVVTCGKWACYASPYSALLVDETLLQKKNKIALLVFDGLAIDQWIQIRESLTIRSSMFDFDEGACFAWVPTLTSVSRQALFSGLQATRVRRYY